MGVAEYRRDIVSLRRHCNLEAWYLFQCFLQQWRFAPKRVFKWNLEVPKLNYHPASHTLSSLSLGLDGAVLVTANSSLFLWPLLSSILPNSMQTPGSAWTFPRHVPETSHGFEYTAVEILVLSLCVDQSIQKCLEYDKTVRLDMETKVW